MWSVVLQIGSLNLILSMLSWSNNAWLSAFAGLLRRVGYWCERAEIFAVTSSSFPSSLSCLRFLIFIRVFWFSVVFALQHFFFCRGVFMMLVWGWMGRVLMVVWGILVLTLLFWYATLFVTMEPIFTCAFFAALRMIGESLFLGMSAFDTNAILHLISGRIENGTEVVVMLQSVFELLLALKFVLCAFWRSGCREDAMTACLWKCDLAMSAFYPEREVIKFTSPFE